jgi:hypothetical protein
MNPLTDRVNLFHTQKQRDFQANILVFQRRDARHNAGCRVEDQNALYEFCGGSRNV